MWRVGFRLKCLVKLVKNFNFFAVSASPGPQGHRRRVPGTPDNRLFSNAAKGGVWGCCLKRLVKLVKNFDFFAVSASPDPQGHCQRVPKASKNPAPLLEITSLGKCVAPKSHLVMG